MNRTWKWLRRALGAVLIAGGLYLAAPSLALIVLVPISVAWQGHELRVAKPEFDRLVTSQLRVGQSLDDAERVLTAAGLTFTVADWWPRHGMLQSGKEVGRGYGFQVQLLLDPQRRISTIDVQPYTTAP